MDHRSVVHLSPGGSIAMDQDGRPIFGDGSDCRALVNKRAGMHRCRRPGWFALRDVTGAIRQPLCATHLRLLVTSGGAIEV